MYSSNNITEFSNRDYTPLQFNISKGEVISGSIALSGLFLVVLFSILLTTVPRTDSIEIIKDKIGLGFSVAVSVAGLTPLAIKLVPKLKDMCKNRELQLLKIPKNQINYDNL